KAANYHFGPVDLSGNGKPPAFDPVRSKLDERGSAVLSCPSLPKQEQSRPYRLMAQAGVTEAGSGRASVGESAVEVHPERFYIGLRSNLAEVKAGDTLKVEATLVDWEGNAAASLSGKSVDIELFDVYRESSGWFDEGEGSERQEERYRLSRSAAQRGVFSGKPFEVSFVAKRGEWNWVGYVIRARLQNAMSELKIEGDGAEWYWDSGMAGGRVDRTPKPMRPMPLRIDVPARSRVGQPITAKFTLPFRGHLLVTAESDRILTSNWKVVEAGETTWTFTPHQNTSTVYVSALLVKAPYAESRESFLPNRAFSVSAIALEPAEHAQTVTLSVPNEVRSGAELDIGLVLGKPDSTTYASVAVVDEGVLQLTKSKSPDPLAGLFQKKALGVTTFETIGWSLLMPPTGASRPTGGDGEQASALGRVQPIRPVALWSGWVKFDGAGRARVKLKLPTYRGAVRVMAVTAGEARVGSAEALVRVTDPLVLMSTLPRFVTQGDAVQIPVFVTNLTGQAQDVRVQLSAENIPVAGVASLGDASPLQLLGKPEGVLSLAHGASGTTVFQAKASKGLGTAKLRVRVQAGAHQSEETLVVPFSPQGQRERRMQMVELKDSTLDLKPLVRGWVPTTEKTTFWVTTNPYGESFGHLKSLIHYPYGCIEQTTSSTRPLLYVSNMLGEIDPELIASRKVEDMVASGIARVLSMQTPSGGFGYWPGEKEPNTWGTAYATHFLLDAQKAGFHVPAERVQDAVRWMESVVSGAERLTEDPYHGQHNANAYTHYVLALAGKGRKAQLQALAASLNLSPGTSATASGASSEGERLETAYMLKAALWHAGDRRYEKDLRAPDVSAVTDVRSNGWSFYSDRRRRGFMLSTFTDLFGNDPAGEPLARLVAEALRGRASAEYTTQELVWGISGLGKRLQGAARAVPAPKLWANGKAVTHSPRGQGAQGTSFSLVRACEVGTLRLELAEPPKGKMFLIVSSEGIPTTPKTTFGGEGLAIRRKIRTMSGEAIDPRDPRKLGETFVVELSVTNLTRERVENIALVDRIPAGWEIENPRLGRGGIPWVEADALWTVSAMNVRDDRIELFGPLEKERSATFVYTVRATAAGTFHRPSVEAEAMYDPRIWAREKGGEVRVEGGWADHLL
ncbi:MAG: alpha-2-macroglobulin family protein, partial [Myxococcaceae bacterium]